MRDAPPPTAVSAAPTDRAAETGQLTNDPTDSRPALLTVAGGAVPVPAPPAGAAPESIGGYRVVRKIGEGGMGAVYLAEDARLGRRIAIKTLKPELSANAIERDRFVREARAAAAVAHDNIVPVLHVGTADDGRPFIAMPFLQGETLDARLQREPVAPVDVILKVAREVGDGLAAAHAAGLIHRDIKPGNIWIEGDPGSSELGRQVRRCKILDFGLARPVGGAQLTAYGVVLGTPAFMPPEQARGAPVDPRADLFSLGVVLYRMATGRLPYTGESALAVLVALASDETPPAVRALNPKLPSPVADLIARLMCKDAAGRPGTAAEVVAEVRAIARVRRLRRTAPAPSAATLPSPSGDPSGAAPAPGGRAAGPPDGLVEVSAASVGPVEPDLPEAVEIEEPVPEPRPRRARLRVLAGVAVAIAAVALLGWRFAPNLAPGGPPATESTGAAPAPGAAPGTSAPTTGAPAGAADADRRAALYALSVGGRVGINDAPDEITESGKLPAEPFRLTTVRVGPGAADADFAVFAGCRELTVLSVGAPKVTGAGLEHFRGATKLTHLHLGGTAVADDAVPALGGFRHLRLVDLTATGVTPKGVAELRAALPGCVVVWGAPVAPAPAEVDLERKAARLALALGGTILVAGDERYIRAADALPAGPLKVTWVDLSGSELDDAGLAHFKHCGALTSLRVQKTCVTGTGIDELRKALPKCRIVWDGPIVEPAK